MHYVSAGDARIPSYGLGTYQLKGDIAREITSKALEIGYRHIDTAQLYENEEEVGQAIRTSGIAREDIWVTTKVWYENLGAEKLMDSVKESLDKLQMDQVDLFLVHWPHPELAVREYMPLMQEVLDKGYTKHIGVSNFTRPQIKEALQITPNIITNQVEYHTYLSQEAVLETCRQNDMFVTAYSPIGQGKVPRDERLAAIGKRYGKSAAQVGLRWLVQQGDVVIIPRTSNPNRLDENRDIFDFALSPEEMQELHTISLQRDRLINPSFVSSWED